MHLVRCMIFYCKNNIISEIADILLNLLTKMGGITQKGLVKRIMLLIIDNSNK